MSMNEKGVKKSLNQSHSVLQLHKHAYFAMMNLSDGDLEAWYKPKFSREKAELYLSLEEESTDQKTDENKHATDDKNQEAEERPYFLIRKG